MYNITFITTKLFTIVPYFSIPLYKSNPVQYQYFFLFVMFYVFLQLWGYQTLLMEGSSENLWLLGNRTPSGCFNQVCFYTVICNLTGRWSIKEQWCCCLRGCGGSATTSLPPALVFRCWFFDQLNNKPYRASVFLCVQYTRTPLPLAPGACNWSSFPCVWNRFFEGGAFFTCLAHHYHPVFCCFLLF